MKTTNAGAASVVGADGFPWDYWVFDPVPEGTERERVTTITVPDASTLIDY